MANLSSSPNQQKQTLLQRYHEKLLQHLRVARANNREAAQRANNANRGATSPLGGQAVSNEAEP